MSEFLGEVHGLHTVAGAAADALRGGQALRAQTPPAGSRTEQALAATFESTAAALAYVQNLPQSYTDIAVVPLPDGRFGLRAVGTDYDPLTAGQARLDVSDVANRGQGPAPTAVVFRDVAYGPLGTPLGERSRVITAEGAGPLQERWDPPPS